MTDLRIESKSFTKFQLFFLRFFFLISDDHPRPLLLYSPVFPFFRVRTMVQKRGIRTQYRGAQRASYSVSALRQFWTAKFLIFSDLHHREKHKSPFFHLLN